RPLGADLFSYPGPSLVRERLRHQRNRPKHNRIRINAATFHRFADDSGAWEQLSRDFGVVWTARGFPVLPSGRYSSMERKASAHSVEEKPDRILPVNSGSRHR